MTIAQELIKRFNESGVIFDLVEEQLIDMSTECQHLGDGLIYLFDDNSTLRVNPSTEPYKYYI